MEKGSPRTDPKARLQAEDERMLRLVRRLEADHPALREMTSDLLELLLVPPDARRDERMVVLAGDLAELLRLHLRAEERLAFEWRTRVSGRATH